MLTLGGLEDDYSVFSPLTGLRGRNGGLGLKCRWEALWAIGVKVVSLRSTLSGFWVVLGGRVFGSGLWVGWSGRVCLIYAAAIGRACWTIYCGRGSPWLPYGLCWVRCDARLARGLGVFSTFFHLFHLGVDLGYFARTVGDAARSLTVQ